MRRRREDSYRGREDVDGMNPVALRLASVVGLISASVAVRKELLLRGTDCF